MNLIMEQLKTEDSCDQLSDMRTDFLLINQEAIDFCADLNDPFESEEMQHAPIIIAEDEEEDDEEYEYEDADEEYEDDGEDGNEEDEEEYEYEESEDEEYILPQAGQSDDDDNDSTAYSLIQSSNSSTEA